ncbi:hypothetical protein ACRRTK_015204 [Alexandromys fortis]
MGMLPIKHFHYDNYKRLCREITTRLIIANPTTVPLEHHLNSFCKSSLEDSLIWKVRISRSLGKA